MGTPFVPDVPGTLLTMATMFSEHFYNVLRTFFVNKTQKILWGGGGMGTA
jgi:hypothetical protein